MCGSCSYPLKYIRLSSPSGPAELARLMGVPDSRGLVVGKLSLEHVSGPQFKSLFFSPHISP